MGQGPYRDGGGVGGWETCEGRPARLVPTVPNTDPVISKFLTARSTQQMLLHFLNVLPPIEMPVFLLQFFVENCV